MKVITVRQPWAWAIAKGHKDVENRSWATSYRGPLAIHSAKKWDSQAGYAVRFVRDTARAQGADLPERLADELPWSDTGLILAVVDLESICTASLDGYGCDCGLWAIPGQAHWRLTNPRRLEHPVTATGRLGMWDAAVEVPSPPPMSDEDRRWIAEDTLHERTADAGGWG